MKKFFSTLLVFALMLVFSTSAFAAKGLGDTRDSAIDLYPEGLLDFYPGSPVHLSIENSKDEDWFKWTNNTRKMKGITALFIGTEDYENFRLGYIIKYKNGDESDLLDAQRFGQYQAFDSKNIPDGATVYFVVKKISDGTAQYQFGFYIDDNF